MRGIQQVAILGAVFATTLGVSLATAPNAQAAPNQRPIASFTIRPDVDVTAGTPFTLDASSSVDPEGQPLRYSWDIYAGADHQYSNYGKKVVQRVNENTVIDIKLTVTDPSGATDTLSQPLNITSKNRAPEAKLNVSPRAAAVGSVVTMDGSESSDLNDDPLTYQWWVSDNGDEFFAGSSAVLQYAFRKKGFHTIRLVVTDPTGATNEAETVYGVGGPDPEAKITQTPDATTITAGTTLTFDGSSSSGDDIKYAWALWGEGNSTYSSESKASFTYAKPGTYQVKLTVTDYYSRVSEKRIEITVTDAADPPEAKFTSVPASPVTVGTEVTFDGSASTGDGLKYAWYVRGEPGVVSREKVLKYRFKKAGSYGVELRVTDSTNHTAKQWTGYEVNALTPLPVAGFTATPPSPTPPGTKVTFDGSVSTGDGLKYEWYVRGEQGIFSREPVLNYTFRKEGYYGVQLVVTDSAGRQATKWIEYTAAVPNTPPVPDFTQSPATSPIKAGTTVTFDGSISTDADGDPLKYFWYVRGESGVVSKDPVLNHRFDNAGKYGVELRLVDRSGVIKKKWVEVTVVD